MIISRIGSCSAIRIALFHSALGSRPRGGFFTVARQSFTTSCQSPFTLMISVFKIPSYTKLQCCQPMSSWLFPPFSVAAKIVRFYANRLAGITVLVLLWLCVQITQPVRMVSVVLAVLAPNHFFNIRCFGSHKRVYNLLPRIKAFSVRTVHIMSAVTSNRAKFLLLFFNDGNSYVTSYIFTQASRLPYLSDILRSCKNPFPSARSHRLFSGRS